MHTKIGFVFLMSTFILSLPVETVEKDLDVLREKLENEYKRNHKEIAAIKDVYEKQKEMGDKLQDVHIADMTDDKKNDAIDNLKEEFDQNMDKIERVLAAEEQEELELRHIMKKLTKGDHVGLLNGEGEAVKSRERRGARRQRRRIRRRRIRW